MITNAVNQDYINFPVTKETLQNSSVSWVQTEDPQTLGNTV